ncbi:DNA/RNA helicase domain-containing protein [Polaribacter sp. Z022]|uniref:DNA/RNA helicase domain-containing protein n=1 Tax=Polaribacter sp. Z022 TaxID=2927125 RepID=UPI00201FE2C2|nr:DNA/RNA helicase domain-containing protein [Polaribacter sp. Z022]MCL7754839.1 DUF2075 domain-containing protein [Polaribacter sp. Z022]
MIDNVAFKIESHNFDISNIEALENYYANNLWPLVYILSDELIKEAYIGETTDTPTRLKTHLKNNNKNKLTTFRLISSKQFNKSATLDIESLLIKYLSGDGVYKLLNGNLGIANHNYYQKNEVYASIFKKIWNNLRKEGVAKHSLKHIDNSDLFKYSPYKSLTEEQKKGLYLIIENLLNNNINNTIIEGGAGTGKTILAIFLFKLLNSDNTDFNFRDFGNEEIELKYKIDKLKQKFPNPKIALVVPMSSLRNTLKKVFKNVKGLKASMVIGPAELAKTHYDIIIVDESHRLRRRVNLGAYFGAFDKINAKLNLKKFTGNELDWVIKQSSNSILFYDEGQSIKPSDVLKENFDKLKSKNDTKIEFLQSQFRVKGGNSYVKYIDDLLNCKLDNQDIYINQNYEFVLFDNIELFINEIKTRNQEVGLARMIAGYSWKWISNKNKNLLDIEIENTKLKWNSTNIDWVNSSNAINEVGCIHTTQGYDLNYSGIIFGKEISYSKEKDEIIILEQNYYDTNGKQSINDPKELKDFIINIYKTILLRGIKGTYVYACNKELRDYLSSHIIQHQSFSNNKDIVKLKIENKQFENSVPYYDLKVAAGDFSEFQTVNNKKWVEIPSFIRASEDYFACLVIGESMNKIIPNNSICLFKKYRGGSRNGRIVLAQSSEIHDSDFGSGYTIKEYQSTKTINDNSWTHKSISLIPLSYDNTFEPIILSDDSAEDFKIIGVFEMVLN